MSHIVDKIRFDIGNFLLAKHGNNTEYGRKDDDQCKEDRNQHQPGKRPENDVFLFREIEQKSVVFPEDVIREKGNPVDLVLFIDLKPARPEGNFIIARA